MMLKIQRRNKRKRLQVRISANALRMKPEAVQNTPVIRAVLVMKQRVFPYRSGKNIVGWLYIINIFLTKKSFRIVHGNHLYYYTRLTLACKLISKRISFIFAPRCRLCQKQAIANEKFIHNDAVNMWNKNARLLDFCLGICYNKIVYECIVGTCAQRTSAPRCHTGFCNEK